MRSGSDSRKKCQMFCRYEKNRKNTTIRNAIVIVLRQIAFFLMCLTSTYVNADSFSADVWADNWFAFYVNADKVAEDSVPITTERSFNAESFSFDAEFPFTLGLIAMDFKEDDSGLEYIGTRRQQMGDGGVIVQIKDSSDNTVAVSNEAWLCTVIHEAPLDKSCAQQVDPVAGEGACAFNATEIPIDWNLPNFDAVDWHPASVYSEQEVRPKDGYDRISWDNAAQLIWGPDLETSNTLLCRVTVK